MAGKLYPPYIDGKIPAFSGMALRVPFRNNRAVNINDISGIVCKLKTVSTNEWVWSINADSWTPARLENGECYALFNLAEPYTEKVYTGSNEVDKNEEGYTPYYQWLIVGLYYKIQIAYVDKSGQVGYFSDVGVTKYTSQPSIFIDGLLSQGTNNSKYNYIGIYSQHNADVAEKEFTYSFTIYDSAGNVFLTTGIKTHNSSLDTESYESSDEFYCNKELQSNITYKLQYQVVTNNGLVCESPMYLITKKDTVKSSLNATLEAVADFDNGYIGLSLVPKDDKYYSGNFAVARSSSKDNFSTWDEICRFSLNKEAALKDLFKDFTVEQGVAYRYSIQQYNARGLYSSRILSETLYADFEDMFLFDGKRQLKIRFNPQVSSFKTNILEAKQETIGSQFPFIFRNGSVKYKEFPVSGLISYYMDDQEYFMPKSDLGYMDFPTTDLTSDNIRAERMFKTEVLNWLENGEPKLFRSPTEGNFLVRLMSVSLTPVAGLGRLLHTFSSTAYEIGDIDFLTLNSFGMFEVPSVEGKMMRFKQIVLSGEIGYDENDERYYLTDPVLPYDNPIFQNELPPTDEQIVNFTDKTTLFGMQYCYNAVFEGVAPGTIFGLQFESGISNNVIEYIKIGETGTYQVNSHDNALIAVYPIWTPNVTKVLESERTFDGTFTYGYYSAAIVDNFSDISDLETHDTLSQWYGKHDNIIEEIENVRISTGRFYWMKFQVRNIVDVWIDNEGHIFSDAGCLVEIPLKEFLPTSVYADNNSEPIRYFSGKDIIDRCQVYRSVNDNITQYIQINAIMGDPDIYWTEDTKDPWLPVGEDEEPILVDRQYKFAINHQDINVDLKTIKRYIITDIDKINFLSIGRMIMVDCYYQVCEKVYSIEDTEPSVIDAKRNWLEAQETYWEVATSEDPEYIGIIDNQGNFTPPSVNINNVQQTMETLYTAFYNELCLALNTEMEG